MPDNVSDIRIEDLNGFFPGFIIDEVPSTGGDNREFRVLHSNPEVAEQLSTNLQAPLNGEKLTVADEGYASSVSLTGDQCLKLLNNTVFISMIEGGMDRFDANKIEAGIKTTHAGHFDRSDVSTFADREGAKKPEEQQNGRQ